MIEWRDSGVLDLNAGLNGIGFEPSHSKPITAGLRSGRNAFPLLMLRLCVADHKGDVKLARLFFKWNSMRPRFRKRFRLVDLFEEAEFTTCWRTFPSIYSKFNPVRFVLLAVRLVIERIIEKTERELQ